MFCSKCGEKNEDDAKFCSACGDALGGSNATQNNVDRKSAEERADDIKKAVSQKSKESASTIFYLLKPVLKLKLIVPIIVVSLSVVYWDDGAAFVARLADTGTVADENTGLMWQKCSLGLSGHNCEEGEAFQYKWRIALSEARGNTGHGYSDWRLPTKTELASLIRKGQTPTIDQALFPNTKADFYWSSSPHTSDKYEDSAWGVLFSDGGVLASYKSGGWYVRLVRASN